MPEERAGNVEITIDGFSGPLDLLCHLVESRQMQAAKIKVAQLVRIYGAYLAKTRKASAETLVEFFFMAAELLLQKTLSLLPSAPEEPPLDEEPEDTAGEEELMARLARYRPYRAATTCLEERKARQDRCFRRIPGENAPDGAKEEFPEEPSYDIGDLYFLSRIWWGLIERASRKERRAEEFLDSDAEDAWDGMPEALPEESQIQSRIEELEEKLAVNPVLSLNVLWAVSPSIKTLVVTLLAVLEMCRMGKAAIEQETLFSDVRIRAKG
ncbi:MAG: segregation/condensation protein A [Synergistaceae bacterium]|jgi:segregation and condensation protein A|nr:segregation/condensation protein A [Synergistaceae bacterium]